MTREYETHRRPITWAVPEKGKPILAVYSPNCSTSPRLCKWPCPTVPGAFGECRHLEARAHQSMLQLPSKASVHCRYRLRMSFPVQPALRSQLGPRMWGVTRPSANATAVDTTRVVNPTQRAQANKIDEVIPLAILLRERLQHQRL